MSWIDGVSPCMELGKLGCEVLWEAWGVFVAVVAVFATTFLGIMTLRLGLQTIRLGQISLRLGKAANRAAALAGKIAAQEADARAAVETNERLMVLLQIRAEVGAARRRFERAQAIINPDEGESDFLDNRGSRYLAIKNIRENTFTTAKYLGSRLHYIGHPEAGKLAVVIGIVDLFRVAFADIDAAEEASTPSQILESIVAILPGLTAHVRAIELACTRAAADAGV